MRVGGAHIADTYTCALTQKGQRGEEEKKQQSRKAGDEGRFHKCAVSFPFFGASANEHRMV